MPDKPDAWRNALSAGTDDRAATEAEPIPLPSWDEFPKIQQAAEEKADAEFTKTEAEGAWATWESDKGSVPPWWDAGVEYVWKVLKVKTDCALAAGYPSYKVRAQWHFFIRAVSLAFGIASGHTNSTRVKSLANSPISGIRHRDKLSS